MQQLKKRRLDELITPADPDWPFLSALLARHPRAGAAVQPHPRSPPVTAFVARRHRGSQAEWHYIDGSGEEDFSAIKCIRWVGASRGRLLRAVVLEGSVLSATAWPATASLHARRLCRRMPAPLPRHRPTWRRHAGSPAARRGGTVEEDNRRRLQGAMADAVAGKLWAFKARRLKRAANRRCDRCGGAREGLAREGWSVDCEPGGRAAVADAFLAGTRLAVPREVRWEAWIGQGRAAAVARACARGASARQQQQPPSAVPAAAAARSSTRTPGTTAPPSAPPTAPSPPPGPATFRSTRACACCAAPAWPRCTASGSWRRPPSRGDRQGRCGVWRQPGRAQ